MLGTNVRGRFTADDFEFVVQTLARGERDAVSLGKLLSDESSRDEVLDNEALYTELIDNCGCLKVSPALYFYVVVRRAFQNAGIRGRELSDYVAAVMLAFGQMTQGKLSEEASPYISDLLIMLQDAGPRQRLLIQTHIGDMTMFISGIFPDRVRRQCDRRGAPSLAFYEQIGQSQYHSAAQDLKAREAGMDKVFLSLADNFHDIRCVLNDMSDRVFHLSEEDHQAGFILSSTTELDDLV